MRYDAIDVARYIITVCTNKEKPISNLKLQKMLYFLWVEYFRVTGRRLFDNPICAWKLGPVIPDVYYEYCTYAGIPITGRYLTGVDPRDGELLDEFIGKYIDIPVFELVAETHKMNGAWDTTYEGGIGNRRIIPFELIVERDV